jgi:hypothetical protein
MSLHTRIVTIDEDVVHWPNKKMKKCSILANDNKTYQADLLPEEVELVMELKSLRSNGVLNQWQQEKLVKLIDAYGDARWNDGNFDGEMGNDEGL